MKPAAWEENPSVFGSWLHQLQAGCPWASSLPFLGLISEEDSAVEKTAENRAYKTLGVHPTSSEQMRAVIKPT